MTDPVVCADGHTYERVAITRWFGTGKTRSPVTNEVLGSKVLFPNHCVRRLILSYRRQQGERLLELCRESDSVKTPHFEAECIALVENGGADINARDGVGNSPVSLLLLKKREDLVRILLSRGALLSSTNDKGENALDIARRVELSPNLISLIEQTLEQELLKKEQADRVRKAQRNAYRVQQEQRRRVLEESAADGTPRQSAFALNRAMTGQGGPGQQLSQVFQNTVGFFPSLFGLQFQNLREANSPSGSVGDWLLGDVEIPVEENFGQHHFLSNILVTLGLVLFFLCLCL